MEPITQDEIIKVERISNKYLEDTDQRKGQAYFNALHKVRPDLADHIQGTKIDPFYSKAFDNAYGSVDAFFQMLKDIDQLNEYLAEKQN